MLADPGALYYKEMFLFSSSNGEEYGEQKADTTCWHFRLDFYSCVLAK